MTAALLVASPCMAFAQSPNVTISLTADGRALANQLGVDVGAFEDAIGEQIGALYGVSDLQRFLELNANAQSLANKGLGVDYGSLPKGFIFGFAVAAALDAGQADINDLESIDLANFDRAVPVGVGAQIALMAGYNLERAGIPGLTFYINGMGASFDVEEFYRGEFFNFGAHAQYTFFRPRERKTNQWLGLSLTSGLQFSQSNLEANRTITTRTPLEFSGGTTIIETESLGDLRLSATAWTVPFEATTSVRFLQFFGLYAGMGLDVLLGDASLEAQLSSPLEASDPFNGGTVNVGTVDITADDTGAPSDALFRLLAGLQLHLGPIKAFGQVNFRPDPEELTVSGAVGLRYVQ